MMRSNSFSRGLFVALLTCSCVSLSMPPVRVPSSEIPQVLQPTSRPVILAVSEPAPYDGALLTEGQLRMLKAQRLWLADQVGAAYRLGRAEGEAVLVLAREQHAHMVWALTILGSLCIGAGVTIGVTR